MKKLLLLCLGVLLALPAVAQNFSYTYGGQTLTYQVTDAAKKTVSVKKPTNTYIRDLVIPSTVEDSNGVEFSVTSIGDWAFRDCSGLTSVTLPNSVTSIGIAAFSNCRGLTSVTIPNSVTSIGDYAFAGCSGLTSVTIPNSVTSIGEWAFSYCSGLTKAEFESIDALCRIQFLNSTSNPLSYAHNLWINGVEVKDLVIPNSVTSIGEWAFSYCSGLTSVTIPNSVTSIGNAAFQECTGLTSVTIPNSVTSIGNWAFNGCSGMTSVTIPNSVTSIGNYAFNGCTGLTKAEFASVEALCRIQFKDGLSNPLYYAHNLWIDGVEVKDLVIPNSVTSIGSCAFQECTGLTSVTIPNSVTSIGNYAFNGCTGLTKAEFESIDALCRIQFSYLSSNPLYYAHNLWINGVEVKDLVIPNSVTSIRSYAFSRCTGLTSVTIPNSVTSIGDDAFAGCSGLTSVTIPNSVTSIGRYAFDGCSGLTSVTIPNSVTSIGEWAFSNCTGLTSVTIPNCVTSIGDCAFSGCSGLTSVTIPNSVTSIGSLAFCGCTGLTSVTIPNSVISIGDYAFYLCQGLSSVTIPNSVTSIGNEAFEGCSGLTSVTIPNSVTSIGNGAFKECRGLTSVYYETDEPIRVGSDIFSNDTYTNAILYMSEKGAELAPTLNPWKYFKNIKVSSSADIEDVIADFDETAPYEVFNLNGLKVGNRVDGLDAGIYIVRQGRKVVKIAVK